MSINFPWYWAGSAALLAFAWIVFRVILRRDYRENGHLSFPSTVLEFLVFGLHANLPYLYFSAPWPSFPPLPENSLQRIIGLAVVIAGFVVTLAIMAHLGYRTTLGKLPDQLRQTGPYRWSRNPQLATYGLMLLGWFLLYPSWEATVWMILYAAIAHHMVRTEEEHLARNFGDEYQSCCQQVPRYLSLPQKKGILSSDNKE